MHEQLALAYGPQHWWPAKTPFEVILGAYLTQNTAWKAVERSLDNLRAAGALLARWSARMTLDELQIANSTFRLLHAQGAGAEGVCGDGGRGIWRFA